MDFRKNKHKEVQKKEKCRWLTKVPYWESNTVPFGKSRSALALSQSDDRREFADNIYGIVEIANISC